jgi:two-component system NtrC family sensor kinase
MTALPQDVVTDLRRRIAELERELETAHERENGSAEILRAIAGTSGDAENSLQQIAETTARMFGAPSVTLHIAGDGGRWIRTIRVGATSKNVGAKIPDTQLDIQGHNLPGTVLRENRQIHIPDLDHVDPAMADWPGLPPARAAGARTLAGTPLRHQGKPIGALIVYRDEPVPFTAEELALLQSFADQAVIAIENARLFNETQEALQHQTATAEVLQVIGSSMADAQPVFERILDITQRMFGSDGVAVFLAPGDGLLHLAARRGGDTEAIDTVFPLPVEQTAAPSVIGERRQRYFPDVMHGADVPQSLRQAAQAMGNFSAAITPMIWEGRGIGMISVTREPKTPFSDKELGLLRTFAEQAVIAIENARLFNEVQAKTRDLTESLQQQTATADVLKVISRSVFDLQAVLDTLVESAYKLCGASLGLLYLRNGEAFECKATAGTGVAEANLLFKGRPIRAGRGTAAERVIMTGEVQSITDFFEDPDFDPKVREIIRNAGDTDSSIGRIRSTLAVPMTRDATVVGVIVIARPQTGSFPPRQIELLQTFADQAVIAIENARLFEQVQTRTMELAASLDDLRTAQDRLVQTEKLASLGQLTAGIAHEIKNPLNFVNNFSALSAELTDELNDLLTSATLSDQMREEVGELTQMLKDNLQKVVQHGKRADSIVKNMLLHSREGSGDHRAADINALLDESLNLAYHGARAEKPNFNVTLQRQFDASAGMIEVFPQEITRVLLNLITNGFYAVAQRKSEAGSAGFDPMLSAATRNLGNHVEIRIRDNGTGIPADVKEKMFNPFFTTKPAGEGTGLGLSMSHDIIVKQHGGTIDVETEPGQFTEFRIVLPRTSHSSKQD